MPFMAWAHVSWESAERSTAKCGPAGLRAMQTMQAWPGECVRKWWALFAGAGHG